MARKPYSEEEEEQLKKALDFMDNKGYTMAEAANVTGISIHRIKYYKYKRVKQFKEEDIKDMSKLLLSAQQTFSESAESVAHIVANNSVLIAKETNKRLRNPEELSVKEMAQLQTINESLVKAFNLRKPASHIVDHNHNITGFQYVTLDEHTPLPTTEEAIDIEPEES